MGLVRLLTPVLLICFEVMVFTILKTGRISKQIKGVCDATIVFLIHHEQTSRKTSFGNSIKPH